MKILICTALALSTLLLASCKMRTPRQESWSNPAFEGRKLGKTIILAVTESESLARQYEALFADHLLPYTEAGSLHASEDVVGKIDRDSLESILNANDIRTIIVTRVLNEANRDELVTIGYDAHPYTIGYWGYYSYGYSLSANVATVSSYIETFLETNVYDVQTKALVWSGRKSVFDDRSDPENMKIIIKAVVRDLERKGML